MRDLGDHVVKAFDMLDIDGGIDVDAAGEQFLDVEVAFRVAAAGRVGVGQFVDKRKLGPSRDQGIEIHLLDDLVAIDDAFAWDDFEPLQQHFRLAAAMGFGNADDDINAGFFPGVGALQHLVSLADAGSGADEDLEAAGLAVFAPRGLQQGLRRRALFWIAARLSHWNNIVVGPGPA